MEPDPAATRGHAPHVLRAALVQARTHATTSPAISLHHPPSPARAIAYPRSWCTFVFPHPHSFSSDTQIDEAEWGHITQRALLTTNEIAILKRYGAILPSRASSTCSHLLSPPSLTLADTRATRPTCRCCGPRALSRRRYGRRRRSTSAIPPLALDPAQG